MLIILKCMNHINFSLFRKVKVVVLTLLDKNKSHIGIYQYDSTDRYKTRFSNENTENRNDFKLLKLDK